MYDTPVVYVCKLWRVGDRLRIELTFSQQATDSGTQVIVSV